MADRLTLIARHRAHRAQLAANPCRTLLLAIGDAAWLASRTRWINHEGRGIADDFLYGDASGVAPC